MTQRLESAAPIEPYTLGDAVLLDELRNIAKNEPLEPGSTLSHTTSNECARRGLAERNSQSYFVMTGTGLEVLRVADAVFDMRDAAIEDLRQQLAEARVDRDRYIFRCVELEIRMEEIRRFVR